MVAVSMPAAEQSAADTQGSYVTVTCTHVGVVVVMEVAAVASEGDVMDVAPRPARRPTVFW